MEEKEFDYMNVIPLVDVMLVLLTIVLTTSTFIATGVIPVELPKASKNSEDILKTQTIEIGRHGNIYLNSRPITLQALQSGCLCGIGADSEQYKHSKDCLRHIDRSHPVLIRADKDIALQNFVDVMDAVKKLGFKKVALQTEQKR